MSYLLKINFLQRGLVLALFLTPDSVFSYDAAISKKTFIPYRVQAGDTLSEILYNKFQLQPVYGKNGFIHQVTALNHGKLLKEGDLIEPGAVLLIPAIVAEASRLGVEAGGLQSGVIERTPSNQEPAIITPTPTPSSTQLLIAKPTPSELPLGLEQSHSSPFSKSELSVGAEYLSLSGAEISNQTSGNLLSGLTPTFEAAWRQVWSPETDSRIHIGGKFIQFEPDQNRISISNSTLFNSNIGIDVTTHFTERIIGGIDGEIAQMLFYEGQSGGGLQIDQVPLLRLHPTFQFIIAERCYLTDSSSQTAIAV